MKKKNRILSLITLYAIFICIYVAIFLFRLENYTLFLVLTIGSVAVLSTSTIYTVIQSRDGPYDKMREKKILPKAKSIHKNVTNIIEDYYDAMPLIKKYMESEESYEELSEMNKFIFSIFSQEELDKVNQLDLSKIDKIRFIREMLYFNANERKLLIEAMLNNRNNTDEDIKYTPPIEIIEMKDQIRVYVRSLVEPGEKTKIVILDTTESIQAVKERIGILFDYKLENFLLSSGGILLNPKSRVENYDIDDDDEIALIPSRKKRE